MKKELVTYFSPKDPESEMFRNLRTNIQFMNTDIQTLLVTSTMPGEGKSYVSSNLAITFAQAGKRVILVDSDMRKGRLYNVFDVMPRPGLSNYLSGVVPSDFEGDKNDIINYIQETEVRHLYVISAGNVPPNPAELLVSPKMTKMINELKQLCDIIIFDSTPSLLVADPVILARQVDSAIIVTSYNQTKMDKVEKVKNSIEQVGGKVAGVVVNKVPITAKKYEDSYYYGNSTDLKTRDNNYKDKKIKSFREEVESKKNNYNPRERMGNINKIDRKEKLPSADKVENVDRINVESRNVDIENSRSLGSQERIPNQEITLTFDKDDIPYAFRKEEHEENENKYVLEDKTKSLLDQISQYLEDEKKNLN